MFLSSFSYIYLMRTFTETFIAKTFVNESTRREWNLFSTVCRPLLLHVLFLSKSNKLVKAIFRNPEAILFFMRFKFFCCLSQKVLFEVSKSLSHSPSCDMISLWQCVWVSVFVCVCVMVCVCACVCVCVDVSACVCDILLILAFIGSFLFSGSLTIPCFHYHPMISLLFNSLISCTIKCSGNLFA